MLRHRRVAIKSVGPPVEKQNKTQKSRVPGLLSWYHGRHDQSSRFSLAHINQEERMQTMVKRGSVSETPHHNAFGKHPTPRLRRARRVVDNDGRGPS